MLGHGGRELAVAGGVDSLSRVQIGLGQNLSDWLRRLTQARKLGRRLRIALRLRSAKEIWKAAGLTEPVPTSERCQRNRTSEPSLMPTYG